MSTRAVAVATAVLLTASTLVAAMTLGLSASASHTTVSPEDRGVAFAPVARRFAALRDAFVHPPRGAKAPQAVAGLFRTPPTTPATHQGVGHGGSGTAARTPVRTLALPFTNDAFADAVELDGLPFRATTDTTGSTREPGEPSQCVATGGTAWYRLRGSFDGGVFANTFGTRGPVTLAVYRGSSLRDLQPVGCDTNVAGNSQVGFQIRSGEALYLQVTQNGGHAGTTLSVSRVGPTSIVDTTPDGRPSSATVADGHDVSADGRWVVFVSFAPDLAPDPPPDCARPCEYLYVRDRSTGTTTRVVHIDAPSSGTSPDAESPLVFPTISGDGRWVAFATVASAQRGTWGYAGPADADPGAYNVYLWDRLTGAVEIASRNDQGDVARSDPVRNGITYSGISGRGSFLPSLSDDGRFVLFGSDGTNMGTETGPGAGVHVYLRDRATGSTRLVSMDEAGHPVQASTGCGQQLSADASRAAFATYPLGGPQGSQRDIYVWDSTKGTTRFVTRASYGRDICPALSADGRWLAFWTTTSLVPEDTNGLVDVYAYDVQNQTFHQVSVTSAGEQSGDSNEAYNRYVSLSADGRYCAFDSSDPTLAPGATGSTGLGAVDRPGPRAFLHDLVTGATFVVSVSSTGEPEPNNSIAPMISADGSTIAFQEDTVGPIAGRHVLVHDLRPG